MPRLLPVRIPFLRAVSPSPRVRYAKLNEGHSPNLPAPESFDIAEKQQKQEQRKSRFFSTPVLTLLFILVFALGFLSGKTPHYLRKGTGVLESTDDDIADHAASKRPIITQPSRPHESSQQNDTPSPPSDVHKALVIASFKDQDVSWLNQTPSE